MLPQASLGAHNQRTLPLLTRFVLATAVLGALLFAPTTIALVGAFALAVLVVYS